MREKLKERKRKERRELKIYTRVFDEPNGMRFPKHFK